MASCHVGVNVTSPLQRRGFVSLRGSHRFQDLALMVDGAPQIAELAVDLHEHLVQMPAPLRIAAHVRDASLPNLGGEHWAKTVPPEPNGLEVVRGRSLDPKVRADLPHRLVKAADRPLPNEPGTLDVQLGT